MSMSYIRHVNKIPYAGSIPRFIIVTVYIHLSEFPDRGLCNGRNKILWLAYGHFTNPDRWMGANRVKITKQYTMDAGAFCKLVNDLFTHLLGITVRRFGRFGRCCFRHRNMVRIAVDSAGGRKNKIGDIKFLHAFQKIDDRVEVVLKIHQRFLNRFTHLFICREMDDSLDVIVLLENGECIIEVAEINFIILYFPVGDFFDSLEYSWV